jgi:PDZ domain-containing protein
VSLARRRKVWLWASGALGTGLLITGVLTPLPFIELSPGPTFNTIGDVAGKPLIDISGTQTFPTDGHLDMTTVNERGGPDNGVFVGRLMIGWADSKTRILPREVFYPDDVSASEVAAQNSRDFSDSTSDSVVAALTYLKRPVETVVIVSSVITGDPADGHLEPGDQILAIDGHEITTADGVGVAMKRVKPGDVVVVKVRRGESDVREEKVTTTTNPKDPTRAFMGISVGETARAPFHLVIQLDGVGGPSAGMMLSLGIIDKLTPGQLNGGRFVAGTGTITPEGVVGPIGGIEQKMLGARRAGATFFLAPGDNCADVLDGGIPDGLTVAKISTLSDAVTAVENFVAGKPVTACTR